MVLVKLLVAVVGDNVAFAECSRPTKSMFITGNTLTVFAGGLPIHYEDQGDVQDLYYGRRCLNTLHNHGTLCVETHKQPLIASAQSVTVEGIPIARDLDLFEFCTGVVKATSQTTVFVGGPLPGKGGPGGLILLGKKFDGTPGCG